MNDPTWNHPTSKEPPTHARVGIRWTLGDVSSLGFEDLRLSLWGARRIFGPDTRYAVRVHSMPLEAARSRTGAVPAEVEWIDVSGATLDFVKRRVDRASGRRPAGGWLLSPPRLWNDRHEIELENDCVLWDLPDAMGEWLGGQDSCLMASDLRRCYGGFAHLCGAEPLNTGIIGVPPGFDPEAAVRTTLEQADGAIESRADEQGLMVAALGRDRPIHVVPQEEVAISSPLAPYEPKLGSAGAHFIGLNERELPLSREGQPGMAFVHRNWRQHASELRRRVGLESEIEDSAMDPEWRFAGIDPDTARGRLSEGKES